MSLKKKKNESILNVEIKSARRSTYVRSVSGPLIILDILRCVTLNTRPAANGEWSMLLGELNSVSQQKSGKLSFASKLKVDL